ncbi:MAG: PIN domain-containing protein [Bacteroidia bacterium]|nr:PIN domain-containing protein [Bacteroidia bacterium]
MLISPNFPVVLDACVLYPAPVRDLLLNLADFEFYKPKWTHRIQGEWKNSLLKTRTDLSVNQLDRTIHMMETAFPDACVEDYESLIMACEMPDDNDRHVLVAAIKCKAEIIVTSNLKDFPKTALRSFQVEARHPDEFISTLIDLDPIRATMAFQQQVAFLVNPPMVAEQVLFTLERCNLKRSVAKLRRFALPRS